MTQILSTWELEMREPESIYVRFRFAEKVTGTSSFSRATPWRENPAAAAQTLSLCLSRVAYFVDAETGETL